jgi:excisionase family DNA binding protein
MSVQNFVHLPAQAEMEQAKISSRTLSKYTDVDRVQLSLRGCNGESDDLVLPGNVLQILLDVLSEMSKGNAISLIPHHQEVSTQEAANLLSVSRPYLVGLLEKGDMPFREVGAHRRVLLTDVVAYKEKTDQLRAQALDKLAGVSQEALKIDFTLDIPSYLPENRSAAIPVISNTPVRFKHEATAFMIDGVGTVRYKLVDDTEADTPLMESAMALIPMMITMVTWM